MRRSAAIARFAAPLCALLVLGALTASSPRGARAEDDPRLFSETGYRVADDSFWNYFQRRGGVQTFGYPISRQFVLRGTPVQLFQRAVLQQRADGSVGLLNLLDEGMFPYTLVAGRQLPAQDPLLVSAAPAPGSPDYAFQVQEFVRANAPEELDGEPVQFYSTFERTVSFEAAFPDGVGSADLLPLLNLEIWGTPTSAPTYDPADPTRIYLRFQRGVMEYDHLCLCTRWLLMADYLKALITGERLPADLEAQAQADSSPLLRQYDPSRPLGLARPEALPDTDLSSAFSRDQDRPPIVARATPTRAASPTPDSNPVVSVPHPYDASAGQQQVDPYSPSGPYVPPAVPQPAVIGVGPSLPPPMRAASPEYGMGVFVWGRGDAQGTLSRVSDLRFTWQKSLFRWRDIEGRGKGQFDWSEADRLVGLSNQAGLHVLARIDFQPDWARRDRVNNGPPDNYQDFADFISAFASRYGNGSPHGRVDAIEVWNEVNLAREWGNRPVGPGTAIEYVQLLSMAYDAIKAVDPSIIVVTAGLSPTGWNDETARPDDVYLQWLYDAGLKGRFDVLGAHAPGFKAPPEVSPEEAARNAEYGGHRSFTFRRVEDIRAVMERNGDADRQVWVLEFGWTSDRQNAAYSWHAVTEQEKADYLVRAFQWARQHWSPWVGVMTVWNMPDANWGPQDEMYWWGVTEPDGSPRPAYLALQAAREDGTLP